MTVIDNKKEPLKANKSLMFFFASGFNNKAKTYPIKTESKGNKSEKR